MTAQPQCSNEANHTTVLLIAMENEPISCHVEGSSKTLQEQIDKLTEEQNNLLEKFDVLNKNVDEFKKSLIQLSDKVTVLEQGATERKKLSNEIKILKTKIDELYAIVKENKDDVSVRSDVQEIESCHSGMSCSSKVKSKRFVLAIGSL